MHANASECLVPPVEPPAPPFDPVLQTERRWLRAFSLQDAALVYALNSDPEVVRFRAAPFFCPNTGSRACSGPPTSTQK